MKNLNKLSGKQLEELYTYWIKKELGANKLRKRKKYYKKQGLIADEANSRIDDTRVWMEENLLENGFDKELVQEYIEEAIHFGDPIFKADVKGLVEDFKLYKENTK